MSARNETSPDGLDREYAGGRWAFLKDIKEMGRHGIIASWLQATDRTASVLDIGCGAGPIYSRIAPLGLQRYVGVDLAAEPLEQAADLVDSRIATLVRADFNTYRPDGPPFDAVLFNEVLNYADAPADIVARFADNVAPGGVIAVSIYAPARPESGAHKKIAAVWARTDAADFEVLDDLSLTSHKKSATWRMRLVRPTG